MILFLNSNSVGDIRDFELEGISIGDSFLDYYNKESQKKLKFYNGGDSKSVKFKDSDFEIYDELQVSFEGKNQISEIQILEQTNDLIIGSYRFHVPQLTSGRAIFEISKNQGDWEMTALGIAAKGSNDLDAGYVIFPIERLISVLEKREEQAAKN